MKKHIVLSATLFAAASMANAEDFRNEIGLALGQIAFDEVDFDTAVINYTHYFEAVSTEGVPRAEAGFLSQSHAVSVTGTNTESDPKGIEQSSFDLEGRYFIGESGFYLGAETSYSEIELDNSFFDSETTTFVLEGGYYFTDSTAASVYVGSGNTEISDLNVDEDSDIFGLAVKSVIDVASSQWLALEAEYVMVEPDVSDDSDTFSIAADYYYNQNGSVGVFYDLESSGDDDTTTLGLSASYFVTPQFLVQGQIGQIEIDDTDQDADLFLLAATFRF